MSINLGRLLLVGPVVGCNAEPWGSEGPADPQATGLVVVQLQRQQLVFTPTLGH